MPCKKSELITALNSYANARITQDNALINMAATALQTMVDSLEYAPEDEAAEGSEEA